MKPADRRGERLQRIGLRRKPRQRLDARAGQHQLGAQRHGLAIVGLDVGLGHQRALAQHLLGGPLLDAFEAAKRGAQRLARALGGFDQVDEPPLGIRGEPDADRAGPTVDPACDPALAGSELGGEAKHGIGLGVELVRRHDRDGTARSERAAGCKEAMRSQRGGDSDGGESEGRERADRGEELIDTDARYEPPECERHRGGEDRQHRTRIGAIATHHGPTFG